MGVMNPHSQILVLGAYGLVGSAISRRLAASGFTRVLRPKRAELDLSSQDAVNAYFAVNKPEFVFMSAAKVGGIVANNRDRADFIFENLRIQSNTFEAAFRYGTRRFLFMGSSCIYPKMCPQPIREDYLLTGPLEPTNEPYALAKIAGLKTAESFRRQYGREFFSVMPTNVYGINDYFHPENSHVIPGMMHKMIRARETGESRYTVWGTGKPRREFIFADDLGDACIFLMNRADVPVEHINVGRGEDISIGDLAKLIAKVVGYYGEIAFDPGRPDGTPRKVLDVTRMSSLGWRAPTSLEKGLVRTYEWLSSQPESEVRLA